MQIEGKQANGASLEPESSFSEQGGIEMVSLLTKGSIEKVQLVSEQREAASQGLWAEVWAQGSLALPIFLTQITWFGRLLASLYFIGHLGGDELAGAALAITFANVTGYSIMLGLSSGMDPLFAQAFGAQETHALGLILQRGWALLTVTCLPLLALWLNAEPLLLLLRQDAALAHKAGVYLRFLTVDLVLAAWAQPMRSFLRSQHIARPMAVAALLASTGQIPLLLLLVNVLDLGTPGAALATTLTSLIFTLSLFVYIRHFPGPHREAWTGWHISALDFRAWGPFLELATPACVSTCQEWWAYEALVLMAGFLPHPHVAVAAMAVAMNVESLFYMLPLALSFAASARIGKELGAGRPQAAKQAARVATGFGVVAALVLFTIIEGLHEWMSTFFSKDAAVVALVSKLLIIVGITELGNAPQLLMGGILKGAGRPSIAAWLGIVTYYVLALPLAAFFAFDLEWEVLGLWWALVFAQAFELAMLGVFVLIQDWHELAKAAMNLAHDQGKHGFGLGVPQSKLDRVHSMGRTTC